MSLPVLASRVASLCYSGKPRGLVVAAEQLFSKGDFHFSVESKDRGQDYSEVFR
jgi:hypothetical protein